MPTAQHAVSCLGRLQAIEFDSHVQTVHEAAGLMLSLRQ